MTIPGPPDPPAPDELSELRRLLREVVRGLRGRHWGSPELHGAGRGDPRLGRRHIAVLAQVALNEGQTVGGLAEAVGLSLPAASKLTTELESHGLVRRREHPDDRRRTLVELDEGAAAAVHDWLDRRNRPLAEALATLTVEERRAFLKGLAALASALMEQSACGPLRSHHRAAHRRRSHRDRPL
jgi:DNA-binding MarR family transcriptional regulator